MASSPFVDVRRVVAEAIAGLPEQSAETLCEHIPDSVLAAVVTAADALAARRDRLTFSKMKSLEALDEFNEIKGMFAEAMLLVGIAYGQQLADSLELKPLARPPLHGRRLERG